MRSFKRSRPIIRLSISKWQRSTLAVMTARLIMSSVWGAVGFSASVDVAALRLIASAARVAFFRNVVPQHRDRDEGITDSIHAHLGGLADERQPATMIGGKKPGEAARAKRLLNTGL